jgi:hypothetical protein
MIFLRADVEHPGIGPVQLTLSWIPKDARKIAKLILENADKCEGKSSLIKVAGRIP